MISTIVRALLTLAAKLPRKLAQGAGTLIGLGHYYFSSQASKVSAANLELCFPDKTPGERQALQRMSLIETGKTMMETPAVWLGNLVTLDSWVTSVCHENLLVDAMASGRGTLILLPHVGNWELFNIYFRRHGTMTALYHPPRQAYLQDLMADVRSRHGNDMVPTTTGGLANLYKRLKSGGNVVILPDQVPASGKFVPFYGQAALTDELAARILRKTGAIAVCACVVRNPDGCFRVVFSEPDAQIYAEDVDESLRAVNALIEECASSFPEQYQWEYKRFKERRPGEAKIYRFRKPPGVH